MRELLDALNEQLRGGVGHSAAAMRATVAAEVRAALERRGGSPPEEAGLEGGTSGAAREMV